MCNWNLCLTFQKGLEAEANLEVLEAVGLEAIAAAILEADYLVVLEADCGDHPGGGAGLEATAGLEAANLEVNLINEKNQRAQPGTGGIAIWGK